MISIKALVAALALNMLPTMAAPSAEKKSLVARATADVYFCEHIRWEGAYSEWHGGEGCRSSRPLPF
jgi:hypothetical protein